MSVWYSNILVGWIFALALINTDGIALHLTEKPYHGIVGVIWLVNLTVCDNLLALQVKRTHWKACRAWARLRYEYLGRRARCLYERRVHTAALIDDLVSLWSSLNGTVVSAWRTQTCLNCGQSQMGSIRKFYIYLESEYGCALSRT